MKRLSILLRTKIFLFALILCAVIAGNLISHLLLRKDVEKMSATIHAVEQTLLEKLDKLEKDNQYHRKHMEQAQQESARLQRSIEYHQGLINRAKALPDAATQ